MTTYDLRSSFGEMSIPANGRTSDWLFFLCTDSPIVKYNCLVGISWLSLGQLYYSTALRLRTNFTFVPGISLIACACKAFRVTQASTNTIAACVFAIIHIYKNDYWVRFYSKPETRFPGRFYNSRFSPSSSWKKYWPLAGIEPTLKSNIFHICQKLTP